MKKVYIYGMRLRGYSIGTQPKDTLGTFNMFMPLIDLEKHFYHDLIGFTRKLAEEECNQYDLDYLFTMECEPN